VWPAQQRLHGHWYRGTADAVFQNLEHIRALAPRCVLVLAGDHVYKMDYRPLLDAHQQWGAHLTLACVDVPAQQASAFGVIDTDAEHRIVGFVEKPPALCHRDARDGAVLASMGVYVFDTEFLCAALEADAQREESSHDFGRDVIPEWIGAAVVRAFPFRDPATQGPAYWRDVGTLDAYWAAHMDLLADPPCLDLYDQDWPVWTHAEQLPPATVRTLRDHAPSTIDRAFLSDGVQITSAEIVHSLLSMCVRVDAGAHIADSVVLPGARIGAGCHVRRAIIDADCEVPPGTKIGLDRELDRQRFHVTSAGIILVTQKDLIRRPQPDALDCATDVLGSRVYKTPQENVA
jgi:glucose-1-phosphate adenylyltransferase